LIHAVQANIPIAPPQRGCIGPLAIVYRIARIRRRIGIDEHPFSEIPKRKRHCLRYHRVVARIRINEQLLRERLEKISNDLDHRARLRGQRHLSGVLKTAITLLRISGAKCTGSFESWA
jgi:hypothetical protein